MTWRASVGFSSRNSARPLFTAACTKPSTGGLPSLVLVWPSNCGSWTFTEMIAVRPSRTSSPWRFSSFSLRRPFERGVGVERAGERRAEAGEVGAALVRVDVVGEREQVLLVGVVPLHRDLDVADLAPQFLQVDDLLVDRVLGALRVDVLDEVDDAAVVLEAGLEALAALVDERDPQALGEERHLAEALLEHHAVVVDRLEDLEVRQEGDARAESVRGLRPCVSSVLRHAALVGLGPLVAVAPDGERELLGERVDDGHADAVKSSRDLVAAAVAELAAGVQHGEHHLGGGPLLLLHRVNRDAAAVVGDRDAVVGMDRDLDLVGLAGQRLIDRVVHHLVDQVVEASRAGRADVHAGALADGLETLEDRDVLGPIARGATVIRLLRQ